MRSVLAFCGITGSCLCAFSVLLLLGTPAFAQWNPAVTNSTASIRGLQHLSEGVVWATGTNGHTITRCEMQTDGNFVLYEGATPVFATNTNGHPGAYAAIQDDGNFVIYGPDSRPLYASNTNWCVDSA